MGQKERKMKQINTATIGMAGLILSVIIAVALTLFALAGCENAGDSNTGNNYQGDGYIDNSEDSSGVITTGLVVATAPNEFVGDFSFNGEVVCTGVSVCEFEATGTVEVEFVSKDKLFLNKYAKANPDMDQEVNWDEPGDWGLAPNGTYYDENAKFEGLVKTWVEDGQILLEFEGSIIGAIKGDKFSWETDKAKHTNGLISADLNLISYHVIAILSGNEADAILKRVE